MSSIVGETWRPIPGIDGYEVSDHGRVRSLDRWVKYRNGRRHRLKGRVLKPGTNPGGYRIVILSRGYSNSVHCLVMMAFTGPCPDGMEVSHGDGDPSNNHLTNLRYDTRKNNQADRRKHGTHLEGENATNSKLTAIEALAIYALRGTTTAAMVAPIFNCAQSTIQRIWNGKTWKSVTGASPIGVPSPDPLPGPGNTQPTVAVLQES